MKTIFVPSLQEVDFSELHLPGLVIYDHPKDFPDYYIARIWELSTKHPTNVCIRSVDLNEIRTQAKEAGFIRFPRDPMDHPCIVEVWLK